MVIQMEELPSFGRHLPWWDVTWRHLQWIRLNDARKQRHYARQDSLDI